MKSFLSFCSFWPDPHVKLSRKTLGQARRLCSSFWLIQGNFKQSSLPVNKTGWMAAIFPFHCGRSSSSGTWQRRAAWCWMSAEFAFFRAGTRAKKLLRAIYPLCPNLSRLYIYINKHEIWPFTSSVSQIVFLSGAVELALDFLRAQRAANLFD